MDDAGVEEFKTIINDLIRQIRQKRNKASSPQMYDIFVILESMLKSSAGVNDYLFEFQNRILDIESRLNKLDENKDV